MALRKCIAGLSRRYGDLDKSAEEVLPAKVILPNPTADPSVPDGAEKLENLHLKFVSKLDSRGELIGGDGPNDEDKQHALYLAKVQPNGGAVATLAFVKFTTKYNEDAHRLLAEQDPPLAPALHACICVIGDLFMVVMQYVSPSEGNDLVELPPRPNLGAIHQHISNALELLHARDFVFGASESRENTFLCLFQRFSVRKGGKKRKVRTYRSHVVNK